MCSFIRNNTVNRIKITICLIISLTNLTLINQSGIIADISEINHKEITLEGSKNFRQLGGYKTKDGLIVKRDKLFRSGMLADLTDTDYQIISGLNIQTIVDFRSTSERVMQKTNWQGGDFVYVYDEHLNDEEINRILARLMQPGIDPDSAEKLLSDTYPRIVQMQKRNYSQMFKSLAMSDAPLLFHCSAGKDRTGIAAFLILIVLGVDIETARNDYLLSNKYLSSEVLITELSEEAIASLTPEEKYKYEYLSSLPDGVLSVSSGVTPTMLQEAINYMESESGSVLNYIKNELNISDEEIRRIRSNYLE